ncbi:MAG: hypothetical protein WC723_02590 [Candidatus Omnitrophota bacterium]
MIVPMRKIAVIIQHKDAQSAIEHLRHTGVLHIEHQRPPQSQDINILQDEAGLINACLEIFNQADCPMASVSAKAEIGDWKAKAKHIVDLWKRYGYLDDFSKTLEHQISEWQKWGDFQPQKLQELSQKGVYVRFYQVPTRQLKDFPQGVIVEQVFAAGGIAYCVVISTSKLKFPFKEVTSPKLSLSEMLAKLSEDKKTMEAIRSEICLAAGYSPELSEIKKNLGRKIEFQQALAGMGESRVVSYLTGYIPRECEGKILEEAKIKKWGVLINDPQEDDNVPVLLRNPAWVSLINPLYKLMEVVPGYRELDVSPIFLIFMALFFGMIIGDAGYGAIYFTLTFLAYRKYRNKVKEKNVFFLFYLFSFCAIIWGILTGTVFGQQWYAASGFKALTPALNNTKFLMAFCFFLGAVQLSLAHGWQALSKLPSLTALADIGFICLLWVGFFLAKMFILGDLFPAIGQWLVYAGVVLIVFFISPRKNFLASIGSGLGALALGAMGNFGDVVSYIRLFAVGLAGVAVADSVNLLAASAGNNIIAKALILFAGHSINIILGPISVLVHGVRLNVLEFSLLHGNVTWSGLSYKPLKE